METTYPYTLQNMSIHDAEIVYTDCGEGEQVIVFIHGLASYMPVWVKNIQYFQQYYRCLALDLPGHGLSSKKNHDYTISFYAGIISEWLKRLGIKKAILVGHSMGGQISVKLVTQNPMLFSHLILVAPAGFEKFNGTQKVFLNQFSSTQIMANARYFKYLLNLKNYFYTLNEKDYFLLEELNRSYYSLKNTSLAEVLSKSIGGMLQEPVFDLLSKIIQPTLVLFGDNDLLIPNKLFSNESTQQIALVGASQIRNHKLKMIPESGHFLQFEKPDLFNVEVSLFLRNHTFIK